MTPVCLRSGSSRLTSAVHRRGRAIAASFTAAPVGDLEAPKGVDWDEMREGNPMKLPRLPIPPLEDTMKRYLQSLKPIAGEDTAEFKAASAVVSDFVRQDGQELHRRLVARDRADANSGSYPYSYIERYWDDMYLCGRWALPINSNPFLAIAPGPAGSLPPNADPQIAGAARFLTSFLKFCESVRGGIFLPDVPPGCVAPYPPQLGTGRIARKGRDELSFNPDSRHIVIVCSNRFFALDVLDDQRRQLSEEAISRRLGEIRAAAKAGPPSSSGRNPENAEIDRFIGYLTAVDRDEWAAARAELEKSPENVRALSEIDSALLVVALDEEAPTGLAGEAKHFLHGSGGRNRWFDKHQLVVMADGRMAVNFEHSYSDGVAWCRMLADVWRDSHAAACPGGVPPRFGTPLPPARTCQPAALPPPRPLRFQLSGASAEAVDGARRRFHDACESCGVAVLDFGAFGKGEVKKWGVSPDAAAQMAFQLAHRTMHGHVAPTYESCSTRSFLHGRTENIRACTADGAAFFAAMLQGSNSSSYAGGVSGRGSSSASSAEVKRGLFAKAAATHIALAKEAQKGLGVDRHIAGLRDVKERERLSLGEKFFAEQMLEKSATWLLSTSNLSYPFLTQFGFGAVTGSGYGVGYIVHEGSVRATVTNFRGGQSDATALVQAMEKALADMRDLHARQH